MSGWVLMVVEMSVWSAGCAAAFSPNHENDTTPWQNYPLIGPYLIFVIFVGPLLRVRPRNGILAIVVVGLGLVAPLMSEFIGEL